MHVYFFFIIKLHLIVYLYSIYNIYKVFNLVGNDALDIRVDATGYMFNFIGISKIKARLLFLRLLMVFSRLDWIQL
jgi:hypothetical protein